MLPRALAEHKPEMREPCSLASRLFRFRRLPVRSSDGSELRKADFVLAPFSSLW